MVSCPPCCLPHVSFPPHSDLVGSCLTHRSLTCASCPPHYVSSPSVSCSPHWVLVRSHPMHMPLTCASFPPPNVSSPTCLAHLISTQSCLVPQVGLLPVHAAHLTTSQLGLTPVLRVSALHYSTGIGNTRGFQMSASARALRLTTYYHVSEYFR